VSLAFWSLLVLVSRSASQTAEPGDQPQLPGAVFKAPEWIKDAPYDVAEFFRVPAPEENAAPFYLDAFLEFDPEVARCFQEEKRSLAEFARQRATREGAIFTRFETDRTSVSAGEIDVVLAAFREGLRKLEAAQRRPRCAFACGVSIESDLPHLQPARRAGRILSLKCYHDVSAGDFGAAIKDIDVGLRLSRDLRQRGPIIAQLISFAIDGNCARIMLPAILSAPALQVSHCDQLIALFDQHELTALDSFRTAVKAEHVMATCLIRTLEQGVRITQDTRGRMVEERLDDQGRARYLDRLTESKAVPTNSPQRIPPSRASHLKSLVRVLERHRDAFPDERRAVNDFTREMLDAKLASYQQRASRYSELFPARLAGKFPSTLWICKLILPDYASLALHTAQDLTYIRVARCWIVLRRWKLTHGTDAADLAVACTRAGLSGVPTDPFGGGPLNLTDRAGRLVVYSVGQDGRDDGGLKDAELGRKSQGDFIFPMPDIRPREG
jgi:hypothetical protein